MFLPYCVYSGGIITFTLVLLVAAMLNHYTLTLSIWCVEFVALSDPSMDPNTLGFVGLAKCAFGQKGKVALMVLLALDLWGLMVAYLLLASEIFQV